MKHLLRGLGVTAAFAAAVGLGAPPAVAEEPAAPGRYVELGIGANFLSGLPASGPLAGTATLNYDVGPLVTGAIGRAFANGLRAEFEVGYRSSPAKTENANAAALSYMVDGLYDLELVPRWTVNGGAGLGAATVRINNGGGFTPFAFQGMTGVEYRLTPSIRLGVEYKFLGTTSLALKPSSLVTSHATYDDNAVLLTLRYSAERPK